MLVGVLAKEVIISVLQTLSWGAGFWQSTYFLTPFSEQLSNAWHGTSVGIDLSQYLHSLLPNQASVLASLVFSLLYYPCVSTYAVIRKEIGTTWAWLSVGWSLIVGYACAVLTYSVIQYPILVLSVAICFILLSWGWRYYARLYS